MVARITEFFTRPCMQAAFLGLLFGLVSVAYAQDTPVVPVSDTMSVADLIELAKTLGWPLSFAFMAYSTAEKLLKEWAADMEEIRKDVRSIKVALLKKDPNDDLDLR